MYVDPMYKPPGNLEFSHGFERARLQRRQQSAQSQWGFNARGNACLAYGSQIGTGTNGKSGEER